MGNVGLSQWRTRWLLYCEWLAFDFPRWINSQNTTASLSSPSGVPVSNRLVLYARGL